MIISVKLMHTDKGQYCLAWQTATMPASAFWYYDNLSEATRDAVAMIQSKAHA